MISTENGTQVGSQDKDIVVEDNSSVGVYDQWIAPLVSGHRPRARYEVLAHARYKTKKCLSLQLYIFTRTCICVYIYIYLFCFLI